MSNKHDQEALGGVDEGDFLELLIANERISEWVDQLETPGSITSPARCVSAHLHSSLPGPSFGEPPK